MELLERLFVIVLAAAIGEAVIEFVFKPPVLLILKFVCRNMCEESTDLTKTTVFQWLSAALGIGIAMNFSLGFFEAFGFYGHIPHVDMILTGALIGRGSNWVHEFVTKYAEKRQLLHTVTETRLEVM